MIDKGNYTMYHILMIDDHPNELLAHKIFLEKKGCSVKIVQTAEDAALYLSQKNCSLILLDVDMPQTTGFAICQRFHPLCKAPVVFLSNFSENETQLKGYQVGGVDYVAKDCPLELFWAKIHARLTQAASTSSTRTFPPLTLDLLHQKAFINNENLNLTQTEFLLLCILSSYPGKIWSADALYHELYEDDFSKNTTLVQMHLSRMRGKLEKAFPQHDFIETVWGKGYQFVPIDVFF